MTTSDAVEPTRLSEYDFDLPEDLIAQEPTARRGDSRLLVVERGREKRRHTEICVLPDLLRSGDLLVLNDVRVRPARLRARVPTGGGVELLLLREVEPGMWQCLGKPGKRLRPGARLDLPEGVAAEVVDNRDGRVCVKFRDLADLPAFLDRHGEVPLPPYIRRPDGPSRRDLERYQTVFACEPGAVAAPTAGLHFTDNLLESVRDVGVRVATVTLHVGPATFLPVRTEDLGGYSLEAEQASIPERTVREIEATKRAGGRVIAVGTTTTRTLESRAAGPQGLTPGEFWADAFLSRASQFRVIDGLLTNFHLPKSTLLVLVSAFAGRERVLAAYREAVEQRYRFYSYGDAMLIV